MADCFMASSVETHASIAPQFAVVKEAGALSALLSGSFCSGRRVINKCFQCDAIGLAMLEEGQHSAAHAGGVRVNRTNQRAEQIVEDLSKWCLPRDGMSSCPEPPPGTSGG